LARARQGWSDANIPPEAVPTVRLAIPPLTAFASALAVAILQVIVMQRPSRRLGDDVTVVRDRPRRRRLTGNAKSIADRAIAATPVAFDSPKNAPTTTLKQPQQRYCSLV
jgi:hypothetical protein